MGRLIVGVARRKIAVRARELRATRDATIREMKTASSFHLHHHHHQQQQQHWPLAAAAAEASGFLNAVRLRIYRQIQGGVQAQW